MKMSATFTCVLIPIAVVALLAGLAYGRASIRSDWADYYSSTGPGPTSNSMAALEAGGTGAQDCQLCHRDTNGGDPFNAYGWALRVEEDTNGGTWEQVFAAVEQANSDGSGTALGRGWWNVLEIENHAQPGWTAGVVNTMYFKSGSTETIAPPFSGVLLDPSITVPVLTKTWGGIKTAYGEQKTPRK